MPQQFDSDVKTWQDKIRNGQRFQQRFARSNDWGRYKNLYRHTGFLPGQVPVNLMFSVLRSMTPQVAYRIPKVRCTARKPGLEAELNARIVQKLDNWLLKELYTKKQMKKMTEDNFFCGFGAGIHGYDSEYGFSPKNLDQSGQFTLTQFDTKGDKLEFNSTISPGMPWFLRVRPEDVVFPWGATDRESLPWFAFRVFRPLSAIKSDKKYTNTKDLEGSFSSQRTQPEGGVVLDVAQTNSLETDEEMVELWQVHDAKTGQILALVMDHADFLRKEVDDLQVDGLPVDTISFNPDPDYIYGVPDARIIEPQMMELVDIRTQAQRHRRMDILKALIRKGTLSDDELMKLSSDEVQAFVQVDSDTSSLRDVVAPLNPGVAGILQDLIAQGEVVRGDVRETVGFSRNAAGEYQGKTHISAQETSQVSQAMNIRLDERRDEIAELLNRIVRKWNQVVFEHWTAERVASIIGPDGAKWWLKFSGPQIKAEYDIDIDPDDGPSLDLQSKKAAAIEAARAWAELNQGLIKSGIPVPMEIQRLLFNQFDETGLDVDRLYAQTLAATKSLQQQQQAPEGAGQGPETAISSGLLAQAMQGARQ